MARFRVVALCRGEGVDLLLAPADPAAEALCAELERRLSDAVEVAAGLAASAEPAFVDLEACAPSISSRLISMLRERPRVEVRFLAAALYGSSCKRDQSRVRALLTQLGHQGRVRRVGQGQWEST
jgi:hypothetical protein